MSHFDENRANLAFSFRYLQNGCSRGPLRFDAENVSKFLISILTFKNKKNISLCLIGRLS